MPVNEKTLRLLMEAGVTGDALFAIVRSLDEAEQVTRTVREQSVTPAALRMRKLRERRTKDSEQLREQPVTGDEPTIDSKKETVEEKKDIIVGSRHRTRRVHKYPPGFETFWKAYPTDPGMGKAETFTAWQTMTPEEQAAAIASIPAFKIWVSKQGHTYRVKHAVNFLKARRWEGFAEDAAQTQVLTEANVNAYQVEFGSDEWWAWDADRKAKGERMPNPVNGHWTFPSRFPDNVPQQTSDHSA